MRITKNPKYDSECTRGWIVKTYRYKTIIDRKNIFDDLTRNYKNEYKNLCTEFYGNNSVHWPIISLHNVQTGKIRIYLKNEEQAKKFIVILIILEFLDLIL